ncbi:MAG: TRAP transporter small permease [Halieaceae bacterium]|jgi:TRAP-type C4-dicarboxylate transport system permease small subunit|nr:TRAP transporter small permease [Halieaceae bacterium]
MLSTLTGLIRRIVSFLVLLFFGYMLVAVLVQVVGRYFAVSIDWAAESATLAQIWMVLLAAGLAMREQLHVRVEVLLHAMPRGVQRWVNLIVLMTCLWFLSLAVRGSIDLIAVGAVETSPVLRLPMWVAYLSLPLGLGYFALELVLVFLQPPSPARQSESTRP